MIQAFRRLTSRDIRALAIFAGLVAACSLYFASGALITRVSQRGREIEVARDGKGFMVRALGLQTLASAERQRAELRERYGVPAEIEAAPTGQGYLIKAGPLVKLSDAEFLMDRLRASNNGVVRIVRICGPGISDCGENQNKQAVTPALPADNQSEQAGTPALPEDEERR